MGAKGNAPLITLEGNEIPQEVLYYCGVKRVLPYLPKALNCSRCPKIGHKYDVCPNPQRCSAYGREKIKDHKCVDARLKCRNCGGSHLGTDPSCPSRLRETRTIRARLTTRKDVSSPQERHKQFQDGSGENRVPAQQPRTSIHRQKRSRRKRQPGEKKALKPLLSPRVTPPVTRKLSTRRVCLHEQVSP
ncbi:hypothetical protein HPB48_006682 [Haemaphysalis longicornis]|uniref:Nucleic-acid-binding protein from transposon X-element n=1 Tax=Haemaphysalis longicornis TaxID=44386 RepID=A0A9J6GDC0_HAELO|nr:hypothetical protein HPB48_006682 [Haemaphysalis longicornis]